MLTTQLSIIDASDLARRIPYTVRRSLGAGRPQRSSSIQVYKVRPTNADKNDQIILRFIQDKSTKYFERSRVRILLLKDMVILTTLQICLLAIKSQPNTHKFNKSKLQCQ
jgi:hypothetical protein